MVTMTDIKKEMAEMQRTYEKSEDFSPSFPSLDFIVEAYEGDGGMAKFTRDRADNWYIETDLYTDDRRGIITLRRYANADEVA